ncbi:hypothetical protein Nmel_002939 [Mimus melanotis]
MAMRAVQSAVEAQIAAGTIQGSVNDFFPSEDPKWDSNVIEQMEWLKRYQNWVVYVMRNAIPKAINWSRLYKIK